ncbi:hypothetical protein FTX61_09475 [Nitriliruptoraceae bacterium ZYF776]|nr:hypothetical protein [Profundirhabdus halotolerans]
MGHPRSIRTRLAVAVVAAGLLGCGPALDATLGEGPSEEEFLAGVDRYLGALAVGDLDAAWDEVCQDGYHAPEREEFDAHHAAQPRPTAWEVSWQDPRSRAISSGPQRRGGRRAGADVQVVLDDGRSGDVLVWYERAGGVCRVSSPDRALADVLRPTSR